MSIAAHFDGGVVRRMRDLARKTAPPLGVLVNTVVTGGFLAALRKYPGPPAQPRHRNGRFIGPLARQARIIQDYRNERDDTMSESWTKDEESKLEPFKGTTHYFVVLDKSGSMREIASEVISGFNEWLAAQQAEPGDKLLTLTLFDTQFSSPIRSVPIGKVLPLTEERYRPAGLTALYDAMVDSISGVESIAGDRYLVLGITDGQENSSQRSDKAAMLALIAQKEALGNWTFTYLSAAPTAFADASSIGVQRGNTVSFIPDAHGTRRAFAKMSASTMSYGRGSGQSVGNFYSSDTNPGNPIGGTRPPLHPPLGVALPQIFVTSPWVSN